MQTSGIPKKGDIFKKWLEERKRTEENFVNMKSAMQTE